MVLEDVRMLAVNGKLESKLTAEIEN